MASQAPRSAEIPSRGFGSRPHRRKVWPNQKKCANCGDVKLAKDFRVVTARGYSRLASWCTPCQRLRNRKYDTPSISRNRYLKKTYKIDSDDFESLLRAQGNACAICRSKDPGKKPFFMVDHCHAEKKLRGILCLKCNLALGYFDDDVDRLRNAIGYLERKEDGMGSQAARSAQQLRDAGYFVAPVEQVIPHSFIKRDCFGAFDYIAVKEDIAGVLGVQVCASDRQADHIAKLKEIEAVWAWLRAGNHIVVHSWRKRKEKNEKTGNWGTSQWAVVEIPIMLTNLEPEPDWTIVRARLERELAEKRAASLAKRQATLDRKKAALRPISVR